MESSPVLPLINSEILGKLQASLNLCFIVGKKNLPHGVMRIKSNSVYDVSHIVLTPVSIKLLCVY